MQNCFTITYKYLSQKYDLPKSWRNWKEADMKTFVIEQKRFLARKEHFAFFKSFCKPVKKAKKDDIVLTRKSVGVAINQFTYWVWSEDLNQIIHLKLDKDCLLMRING